MNITANLQLAGYHFCRLPYVWLLSGLLIIRILVAAITDLVPDEAYYWLWAQHLNVGYYDHPPMVAWFIALGTAVFGDTSLGVRFVFILSFLGVAWLAYDTTKLLFGKLAAGLALLYLNVSLLLSVGTLIATPDPPSVLFWMAGIWTLARLVTSQDPRYWIVFGLCAGLGVLAKYTNLFLGLGVLSWLVFAPNARSWLRSPWLYVGACVAILTMAPNILWNIDHNMVTITKQFGRVGAHQFSLRYIPEFIISQLILINPIIAILAAFGVLTALKTKDDKLLMVAFLNAPLIIYLALHVFHDRIQGNWPAPLYPALAILAAKYAQSSTQQAMPRLQKLVVPVGLAFCSLAFGLFAMTAFVKPLPGLLGLNQGWAQLARQLDSDARQNQAAYIATNDYDLTGELAYQSKRLRLQTPIIAVVEPERYPWQILKPSPRILVAARGEFNFSSLSCFSSSALSKIYHRNDQIDNKHTVKTSITALISAQCTKIKTR